MSFMHDPNSVSTGRGLNLEDSPKTTSMLALDSNLAAVISYFPVVPFNIVAAAIWLKTEPHNNRFVRFCAMQSLAVAAAWFVVGVGTWVVGIIPSSGRSSVQLAIGSQPWLILGSHFIWHSTLTKGRPYRCL
jgi:uncharacterized membrane protein